MEFILLVSYDTNGNGPQPGYNAFINGKLISDGDDETAGNQHDDNDFKSDIKTNFPASSEYYIGAGELSGSSSIADFNGVIDEVRFVKYEKNAFAAGIMISQVVPSTNTITIYNSQDFTYDLDGIEVYNGGSACNFGTGTLASGATTTCTLSVSTTDGLRMTDKDGGNDGGTDVGFDEDGRSWVIDGVCWNSGSGTDTSCDVTSDPLIHAGLWTEDTYADLSEGDGDTLKLVQNGDNDEACFNGEGGCDWYVPEFSTILMPIASVMLIVGYNYNRRREIEE